MTSGSMIDHEMFPHIFELILQNAPRESLLAIRGTCKAVRDRVDVLFCRHVRFRFTGVLGGDAQLGTLFVTPDNLRIPCMAVPLYMPIPLYPRYWHATTAHRDTLRHVEIVDCHAYYTDDLKWGDLAHHLVNLQTIRTAPKVCKYQLFVTPTLIQFHDLCCSPERLGSLLRWGQPPEEDIYVADWVTRWVAHIRFDPREKGLSSAQCRFAWRPRSSMNLAEIVILLSENGDREFTPTYDKPHPPQPYGMLQDFILLASMFVDVGIAMTIVMDFDSFKPEWINLPDIASPAQVKDTIYQRFCETLERKGIPPAKMPATLSRFRILEWNEYAQLVGPEQLALETVWIPEE